MSEPIDVNFEQWDEVHSAKAPAGVKDTNGETWVCDEGEHEQPYPILTDGSFVTEADKNQMRRDIDDQGGWLQIPEPEEKTPVEQELEAAANWDILNYGKADHLLEKTNELYQILHNRPEGDGPYFAASKEEITALLRLYKLLESEL